MVNWLHEIFLWWYKTFRYRRFNKITWNQRLLLNKITVSVNCKSVSRNIFQALLNFFISRYLEWIFVIFVFSSLWADNITCSYIISGPKCWNIYLLNVFNKTRPPKSLNSEKMQKMYDDNSLDFPRKMPCY